jgi:hypothetical protein
MNHADETREVIQFNLQQHGLRIFPLRDKRPEAKAWQEIDEFVPENKPFGVHFTEECKVIVIDVDDMRLLSHFKHFFDRTYCVQTGRGFHIYIAVNAKAKETIHHFINDKKQKIDILSSGGYVCGETSEHYDKDEQGVYFKTGKQYKLLSKDRKINSIDYNKEIKPILEKLKFNLKKTSIRKRNVKAIENGVETGNRNTELFALACNNLKSGVSPQTAYDMICFINQQSDEPLSKSEVDQLFQSATSTVQGQIEESNTVHKIDDKTIYRLTDEEEKTLRPITANEDERLILVYLNTDVEIAERKDETLPMAYFVVNGKHGKALVSYENAELQKKYSSSVFQSFKALVSRWKNADIQAYLASDTKVNPKDLFDNLLSLEREYFENPYDYDYFYEVCWKVHTYFYPLFTLTPYNDYTGMKNCGKSKRLKLNKFICYNSWSSDDSSNSSLFRTIGGTGATMLLDEVEKLGSTKTDNSDLQTILRGGFQNGHYVTKSEEVRGKWTPVAYDVFSPKAFGHINPIDNVLQDRCITTKLARTTNKTIANSEPEEDENPKIYQCREGCYRLFLDHANEVKNLIPEARGLFTEVSGRELNLWLPIVTIALFFEKHGVVGLVDKIMAKLAVNSEEKKTKDAEQNDEVKILSILLEANPESIPKRSRQLYAFINRGLNELYNIEPVNDVSLCNYLENLGFTPRRDNKGTHWININAVKISEAKERCGMIKESQATLSESDSSVGSVS